MFIHKKAPSEIFPTDWHLIHLATGAGSNKSVYCKSTAHLQGIRSGQPVGEIRSGDLH